MQKKEHIPIFDPLPELRVVWEEIQTTLKRVFFSGQYILGDEVEEFEHRAANFLNTKHAIAVNSGTDALTIALYSLGIGPGDEVITTPFTFFATAEAVSRIGATPVFIDINLKTLTLDPALIDQRVSEKTKAIIPVHLFGRACDMSEIERVAKKNNLIILEDVAQAFGALYGSKRLGTIGKAGIFSFFPTKSLSAYGDGGLLVTNDQEIAERARKARNHGAKNKFYNEFVGYNSRLDALQAAILRLKLGYLDEWNSLRRKAATVYNSLLSDCTEISTPFPQDQDSSHVYNLYTVRVAGGRRDGLKEFLNNNGISVNIYYPVPLHNLPVYKQLGYKLPFSEQAAQEVLSLPFWPLISPAIQERVVQMIKVFFKKNS